MDSFSPKFRSKLGRARGYGAAHHGVAHWWLQRLTALALLPLTVWLVASLLVVTQAPDPFRVADWLASPVHAALLALLLVAMFWHATLGLQVIVEDYVHVPAAKFVLLIGNGFFCWGALALSLLAVLKLHMISIVSGV